MAYFREHKPEGHVAQFAPDAEERLEEPYYDPEEDEDLEEEEEIRRDRFRLLGGVADLFGTVLGALCILGLLALLISLVNWVSTDLSQSFSVLGGW